MCWVDVANNAAQWADEDGKVILSNWILASINFDKSFSASTPLGDVVTNSLRQAAYSFFLLKSHIVNNDGFKNFITATAESFKEALDGGDNPTIDAYMLEKFDEFNSAICDPQPA